MSTYAFRYKRGTALAERYPNHTRGMQYGNRELAEAIRDRCPNAEHMEVVEVDEHGELVTC